MKAKNSIRKLATAASSSKSLGQILRKYPVGLSVHGYEIDAVQPIPEFSLVAVKLKHLRTGSEHLHLDPTNDTNNVFSIGFKTNPPDATGVPHILEHTTLCGSSKYPVRDPFFKMLNRSLSNFMNAMTGHDYTFYPFATTNAKDFDNLMDVYLSSVFGPLLTMEDFTQEGWRLENSNIEDDKSPIVFKGVVFNEMKGQYNNSSYYFYIKFQESLYPSLKNSGGDPKFITDLHYEDLIDFHAKNYHPSNSKTFTYGSLPLKNHLSKLDSFYVGFGKRNLKNNIKKPLEFGKYQEIQVDGPFDSLINKPIEEQWKASITWKIGNPLNENENYNIFKWKLLSSLLCDGHNAPFYQELIEKRFGDDFSANTGFDITTALYQFTLGVDNINRNQVDELESKIKSIFTNQVLPELQLREKSSFHERIQAALHQIELNFKKHKPDFGIGLLNSILPSWINGVDPINSLQVDQIIETFKEDYSANGLKIFEDLLKESILNENTPVFKFIMEPKSDFADSLAVDEQNKLKSKVETLTDEDKEIIFERGKKLAKKQQSDEDISVLPTLTMSDIPKKGEFHPLDFSTINSVEKLQKRIVNANGLVYAAAKRDISYIPIKFYKYLPLFTSCLTNLAGTNKTPITKLETKIQTYTGGLNFSVGAVSDPFNIMKTKLQFVVNGMALNEKSNYIYDLWSEILYDTVLEPNEIVLEKLSTLIKSLGTNQLNTISEKGHIFANSFSNAQLTPTKYVNDILSGMKQVEFVMEINKKLDTLGNEFLIHELLPILREIQDLIIHGFNKSEFEYSLLGDKDSVIYNEKLVEHFDASIKTKNIAMKNELSSIESSFKDSEVSSIGSNTFINMPFQIGFASLAKPGCAYVEKDGAALQVLSQLLTFKYLHSVIRESNGAYGGGLNYDGLGGSLNYYSFRDPNPIKSVASFKASTQVATNKIANESWNSDDLQEAKLAIFQSIDAPSHIAQQGASYFLKGVSDEMRQARRENFIEVSLNDVKNVAEKYLVPGEGVSTVVGNANIEKDSISEYQVKELEV